MPLSLILVVTVQAVGYVKKLKLFTGHNRSATKKIFNSYCLRDYNLLGKEKQQQKS